MSWSFSFAGRRLAPTVAVLVALTFLPSRSLAVDAELQIFLEQQLITARNTAGLPAIAALVQIDGDIKAIAATGTRRVGRNEPVTVDDLWHIGSDTKAMTSAMIARLIERADLTFETTAAECFPDFADKIDAGLKPVTLTQLLSHTAGIEALADATQMSEFQEAIGTSTDLREQRLSVAQHYLGKPPAQAVGSFVYSNIGYMIAGSCAEQKTGKSWETLIQNEVFVPLGITHAGFGPPGTVGAGDQPRGHRDVAPGQLIAIEVDNPSADNPRAVGPAGTVHISLRDWLLFAQDHLDGELGRGILKPETYKTLHTEVAPSTFYALGWGVRRDAAGAADLLMHTGSNGAWVSDIRIFPKRKTVYLIVTNAGTPAADAAIKTLRGALDEKLAPSPAPAETQP